LQSIITQANSTATPLAITAGSGSGSVTNALSITDNNTNAGSSAIEVSAVSGFAGTLESLIVNGSSMFSVDSNGNVIQNGNLTVNGGTITVASTPTFSASTASNGVNFFTATTGTIQIGGANGVVQIGGAPSATPTTLRLGVGNSTSDPSGEVDGAMYFNSATASFRCGVNSAWVPCGTTLVAGGLTSTPTINATTTYTTAGVTYSAPTLQAGQIYSIHATGQYASASSGTGRNAQIAAYWGTTQLPVASSAVKISSSATTSWTLDMTVEGTGTTSVWTTGTFTNNTSAGVDSVEINQITPASTTVPAGGQTLDLRFSMSNATPADQWIIDQITIQRLS
jgi:hypothetical protein